jgi:hypothetical protein
MASADQPPTVPTISGSTAGPSGIVHLPRLWLKLLLHARGRLAEGYFHANGGTDLILLTGLGVDAGELVAFVERERPDYLAFERWVLAHAKDASPESIAAVNEKILHGLMPEPRRSENQRRFGVAFGEGWKLNQLDDWAALHEHLVATRD